MRAVEQVFEVLLVERGPAVRAVPASLVADRQQHELAQFHAPEQTTSECQKIASQLEFNEATRT